MVVCVCMLSVFLCVYKIEDDIRALPRAFLHVKTIIFTSGSPARFSCLLSSSQYCILVLFWIDFRELFKLNHIA